jgi:hypothetical protein
MVGLLWAASGPGVAMGYCAVLFVAGGCLAISVRCIR